MIKKSNKISRKIKLLGLHIKPEVFIYMRLVSTLILFIGLLFLSPYGYIVAPICALIYYFFLEYIILDCGIKRRTILLEKQADEFFSTFLLILKGNHSIKNSLVLTTSVIDNELSEEFKRELANVKGGKTLDEALTSLKDIIPSLLINNIIISIMEANRYGNSLNESITLQLDFLREKENKSIIRYYRMIPYKAALLSLFFGFLMIGVIILFSL